MEHLALMVIGPRAHQVSTQVTEMITDMDCFVTQALAQSLGMESAFTALITGNWNNIVRLENLLNTWATEQGVLVSLKRTQRFTSDVQLLPYNAIIIALDQVGTVFNICNFFTTRGIVIEKLNVETYLSSITGTPMLSIGLAVSLPAFTNIAELREQFLIFCDDLNIDGILEPDKK